LSHNSTTDVKVNDRLTDLENLRATAQRESTTIKVLKVGLKTGRVPTKITNM